jgi:hypothetical protein
VFNILAKEQFFLSKKKMQILPEEVKLLGHIITKEGIKMDPAKVDKVKNRKN